MTLTIQMSNEKTTANVLEAITCIGVITGTAYLIKVDEVEASAV